MLISKLSDWQLTGFFPYVPLFSVSVETRQNLTGVTPTVPAKVPGSIYDDLLRSGIIEDPYYETNSLKCEWVANRWWVYKTECTIPSSYCGQRIRLIFDGIDYKAHIFFNNMPEHIHEGMFTRVLLDVTDYVYFDKKNCIQVILENVPDEMGQIGHTSKTFTQKARFGYKWDFGTRLVNLGLYGDAFIDAVGSASITYSHVRYKDCNVEYSAEINGKCTVRAELSLEGMVLSCQESISTDGTVSLRLPVSNPKLWFPNGYGGQPLYDLKVTAITDGHVSDEKKLRIGLRTIQYERCDGAKEDALPYYPIINGKRIYIKGVNLTPLDHMYGAIEPERYRKIVQMMKEANINLVRVWGGGLIECELFYDLCDQNGIMIWQEFIQSSSGIDNTPSEDPSFLKLCTQTAEHCVRIKRNHVSLSFWSGGNELFDYNENGEYLPVTFRNKNIAMLKAIVNRLDPDRQMLPSSASGPLANIDITRPDDNHDVHGPWKYAGVEEHYNLYNNSTSQLQSEFGCDGLSEYSTLCKILSPKNLHVANMTDNYTWRHHGEWWDTYKRDTDIFGAITDLKTFISLSQFIQAEGIRYTLEANRRREGKNCGSIVWQLNEPWPNVSCTSLVDYYLNPKLAYFFTRDAFKPYHVSLKYNKLLYHPGEIFTAKAFVHGDEEQVSTVCIRIFDLNMTELACFNCNDCKWVIPVDISSFVVQCEAEHMEEKDISSYLMFVTNKEHPFASQSAVLEYTSNYMKSHDS